MTDARGGLPPTVHLPINLRSVEPRDLPMLFEFQLDPESNRMAGTKPRSEASFQAIWGKILNDPAVMARVIVGGGDGGDGDRSGGGGGGGATVVGSISCFKQDGCDEVGYWIAREHWGKGIASQALALFLREATPRPMHATVVRANAASIRVLEKCGFAMTGCHMGSETERYVGCEVATFVLK